jgi:hypothetical protein
VDTAHIRAGEMGSRAAQDAVPQSQHGEACVPAAEDRMPTNRAAWAYPAVGVGADPRMPAEAAYEALVHMLEEIAG